MRRAPGKCSWRRAARASRPSARGDGRTVLHSCVMRRAATTLPAPGGRREKTTGDADAVRFAGLWRTGRTPAPPTTRRDGHPPRRRSPSRRAAGAASLQQSAATHALHSSCRACDDAPITPAHAGAARAAMAVERATRATGAHRTAFNKLAGGPRQGRGRRLLACAARAATDLAAAFADALASSDADDEVCVWGA